ncbi:MAG TPA: DHA2 family efflux MFS transporter permease subunit [Mariprofundaceae bacterium]|nr:DHA2 family efflux MFS transporter permease subunit [Mariprofundaceae bacterium]
MNLPKGEDTPLNEGVITFAIMLATVMQVLDMTIVNVALPYMQGGLSATRDQIAWVLTSYIVASAVMTPVTGWISARFGRKRVFLWSVVIFTLTSMMCGVATTLTEMVFFRMLQGLAGAALVPLSQSILLDTYPREKHGSAMALWGMGIMVGPILGPTLGGYLTEYANWRWVFFMNLPVGILATALILGFVPETKKRGDVPFDFQGFFLLSLAVSALQMMLDRGERLDWFSSTEILVEFALAGFCLYAFLVHAWTTKHPFLDLRLLKDRNYASSLVFIFIVGIILFSTLALMPPFLQSLLDYPVLTTGLMLAPRGFGTMLAMMVVGRLLKRFDARPIMMFGFALTAESLWEMSGFNLDIGIVEVVRTGIIQGIGLGCIFVPLSTIAYATLAPEHRNEAASVFSLLRNVGSSIGISVMFTGLDRYAQINHAYLGGHVSPFNPWFWRQGLPPVMDPSSTQGLLVLNGMVTRQAELIGFLNDFRAMMLLALVTMPLVWLMRSNRVASATAQA